ncbi:hypothetical protein I79_017390 [Cricetulus griseus]|uniref:Uncharacterized protein n=1 Tax=Cricetulus griseus TaxID=10029 RepID=G3I1W9_CRIGR|nr:hypothetical protein I79_017390 [Cricetulus griseus]
MNWPYCRSPGTTQLLQGSQPPMDKARSLTINHGEHVPPKPSSSMHSSLSSL